MNLHYEQVQLGIELSIWVSDILHNIGENIFIILSNIDDNYVKNDFDQNVESLLIDYPNIDNLHYAEIQFELENPPCCTWYCKNRGEIIS